MGIAMFLYRCKVIGRLEMLLMIAVDAAICFKDHGAILVCISILSLLAIHYLKRVPAMLMGLGTISYSLYLTHAMVVHPAVGLMNRFTHGKYMGVNLLVALAACILVAYLYYLAVEKPFLKLSKRYKARSKAREAEVFAAPVEEPVQQ